MTIGSLFAGIGGLELGLERVGLGPVVWQAENDPDALRVLAHRWPNARRYRDVREVDEHAERPTIICGGFPCQDISLAGTGAGLEGERSGLWTEFARIVRALRPRVVVVENVAALLARGLDVVLGDLASCGYDALWDCIPASAVGAPHRRDRLFVVAWRVPDPERDDLRQCAERGAGAARPALARDAFARAVGATRRDLADAGSQRGEARHHARGSARANGNGGVTVGDSGGDHLADPDGGRFTREPLARGKPGHGSAPGDIADGCNLPLWPPAPDDVQSWGRVPMDAQPAFCRLADELPAGLAGWAVARQRRAALRLLGNSVVPAVGEVVGRVVREVLAL